jgi:hypothetical protein
LKVQRLETQEFEHMSKGDVIRLANELKSGSVEAVERAVRFVCADSEGLWHGRGRAMMCRRMKHLELPRSHRESLVSAILDRLESGCFSEQFRDQLRLAMHLNGPKSFSAANSALSSEREHVRRYAKWVLAHQVAANDA